MITTNQERCEEEEIASYEKKIGDQEEIAGHHHQIGDHQEIAGKKVIMNLYIWHLSDYTNNVKN